MVYKVVGYLLHITGGKLRIYICIYFYMHKETLKAISKTNNTFLVSTFLPGYMCGRMWQGERSGTGVDGMSMRYLYMYI